MQNDVGMSVGFLMELQLMHQEYTAKESDFYLWDCVLKLLEVRKMCLAIA